MSEEIIKFIEWIGNNQYHKSGYNGDWVKNCYLYGNITHCETIAKTTEELYNIYKTK